MAIKSTKHVHDLYARVCQQSIHLAIERIVNAFRALGASVDKDDSGRLIDV
jgi:hypothetical protein